MAENGFIPDERSAVLRRVPFPAALAGGLVLALSGCVGDRAVASVQARTPQLKVVDPGPSGVFPIAERLPAPAISGTTLDGEPLDVADLRGKVVVVNFWASWCAPCRAEAPNLRAVAERRKAEGAEFVGVAIKDDRDAAQAFERRQGIPYPSLFDQAGVVLTRFRALAPQVPPTTLVLDRQGRVAARFIGGVTEVELDGPVQSVLRERPA